jgi:hypothetical protein
MSMLDDPRCPRCQGAVPLRELWKEAPKVKGLFLQGKVGIVCPSCGGKLRVLESRVVFLTHGLFAIVCVASALLGDFERAHEIKPSEGLQFLTLAPLVAGMFFLQWRYAYRFASVRNLKDGELVSFPLSVSESLDLLDEKNIDMALLSRVAAELKKDTAEARTWTCPKCKEQNPGEFDSCWKCQTAHGDARQKNP